MSTQRITLDAVANSVNRVLPGISIVAGDGLCWSPKTRTITYRLNDTSKENIWGLLHEAGHASLDHIAYSSDMELLQLEAAAWDEALKLGVQTGHIIDPEHIQDCLDTYRDWLHQRSTCPRCGIVSFQETISRYKCHNCHKTWTVSASRLCRPYRLAAGQNKNRSREVPQAVFQQKVA
jgi:ribosomal protein S27AE